MTERDDNLIEQGNRVLSIIDMEGLTQAEFSQRTGIKTSTLNHVVKGRNDISPYVMHQITSAFPEYNEKWIRNGVGEMKNQSSSLNSEMREDNDCISESNGISNESIHQPQLFDYLTPNERKSTDSVFPNKQIDYLSDKEPQEKTNLRRITKIIVYYSDNTFETFTHS